MVYLKTRGGTGRGKNPSCPVRAQYFASCAGGGKQRETYEQKGAAKLGELWKAYCIGTLIRVKDYMPKSLYLIVLKWE